MEAETVTVALLEQSPVELITSLKQRCSVNIHIFSCSSSCMSLPLLVDDFLLEAGPL